MIFFYTVTSGFRFDYRIKGSKFLGFLQQAASISDAEKILTDFKSEHPSATHHCYAYRINPVQTDEMAADDGEPGGTAGLPILNILRSFQMMNVILIVVRYYGGTKLGKSGLIDAYRKTAEGAICEAVLKKMIPVKTYRIIYEYAQQGLIDKLKHDFHITEMDASYLEHVELLIGCPLAEASRFESILSSKKHILNRVELAGDSYLIKN
ncbi:MAG: DUF1949 domain-containing protein [Balneolaceae bacterium]|nr:MAG: DUF1949 domain-containing protein [Balneolaceae bacterium]